MSKSVYLLSNQQSLYKKLKEYFPEINIISEPKSVEKIKSGLIFISIKEFGIVPVPVKKGLFPIAVIDKNLSRTNLAAFIMRIMSKNYFEYIEYPFVKKDIERIKSKVSSREEDEKKVFYFQETERKSLNRKIYQ